MHSIIKISEAATLALHTMYFLSITTDRLVSTKEIATTFSISENHLAKVLQRLAKTGLVDSIRGPKGGFNLGKSSDEITLLQIYEAIEGPLELSDCLLDKPICGGGDNCVIFNGLLDLLNKQVKDYMGQKKLSELRNLFPKQV
ncbi:MAG: transcriptional regulator, BadM/Rrf2 family [uncultured bacterium]|nr:MAG: transcriptional regulator, BadM/Rrf2 family [uncultured bacterium]HBH17381.1 Rrf2 family transcriptional regulator [Cyanobacteria bacterium UBA9579]